MFSARFLVLVLTTLMATSGKRWAQVSKASSTPRMFWKPLLLPLGDKGCGKAKSDRGIEPISGRMIICIRIDFFNAFIDVVFLAEKLWDLFSVIVHEAWALLFPKSCYCFQYAGNTEKETYSMKLCPGTLTWKWRRSGRNVALIIYRRKFTSSKLYACLEKFLCFLQPSDRAYVSGVRCIFSFLLWSFWHRRNQM